MIVYISNLKNSTRELLEFINTFSNEAEYKINKRKREGWRDGSVVKSTGLPKVLSSIPGNHMVAHNHL